ncbi:MAG: hypothetical protein M0Q91_14775 [Methanoregula sp.]|jgi:hypothetical protein|nr:hypothetical protein [Methanoregula sp.]
MEEHGWLDPGRWYFTDDRVGVFHKINIRLLELVIGRQMDRIFNSSALATADR